jgi:hypothetical protein
MRKHLDVSSAAQCLDGNSSDGEPAIPEEILYSPVYSLTSKSRANVRFGSKADIGVRPRNVCFTPKSGHWNSVAECPLYAKGEGATALEALIVVG